MEAIDRVI